MVEQGYASVGSSYRRGGYGVRMAAADTENGRGAFVAQFGEPRTTFLHGQSWGGNVAAKLLEVDGALLSAGLLAGGTRGYHYRLDLRVVYQDYSQNHPTPERDSATAVDNSLRDRRCQVSARGRACRSAPPPSPSRSTARLSSSSASTISWPRPGCPR